MISVVISERRDGRILTDRPLYRTYNKCGLITKHTVGMFLIHYDKLGHYEERRKKVDSVLNRVNISQ